MARRLPPLLPQCPRATYLSPLQGRSISAQQKVFPKLYGREPCPGESVLGRRLPGAQNASQRLRWPTLLPRCLVCHHRRIRCCHDCIRDRKRHPRRPVGGETPLGVRAQRSASLGAEAAVVLPRALGQLELRVGFTADVAKNVMARACVTAGIAHRHPHDLRHRYASVQIGRGVPVTQVAAQLGHSRKSLPLDTYAHVLIENEV